MKRTRMIHSCLHIATVVHRAVFPSCLSSVFLRSSPFQHFVLWSVLFRFFPFDYKVDFFILFYCFLICLQLQSNLNLVLDYSHRVVLKLFLIIWFVFLCPNIFLRRYQFLSDLFAVLLRSGAVRRWHTTGRGYMQAGFPNIIRKTLSDKTNCPMKRTRKIHSCLHIATVSGSFLFEFKKIVYLFH